MTDDRAAKVKLFLLDVDGVLTDGTILLNERGEEIKPFHVRDGLGLKLLMQCGVEVVLITGRKSVAVEHRAKELGILKLYQGVRDKGSLCEKLVMKAGLPKEAVCCMGDDLPDLAMFNHAGFAIAVADAVKEVREAADYITRQKGGRGAVREACEYLLKCKGKWDETLRMFRGNQAL